MYEPEYTFKSSADRVKRESVFAMKDFYEPDPKFFKDITNGTGKLKAIIIEDTEFLGKYENVFGKKAEMFKTVNKKTGEEIDVPWESKIDGWVVMHSDLYKRFIKSEAFANMDLSHMKPAIAIRNERGELFMLKGGVHPADKLYDTAMIDKNAVLIARSAVKALPKGTKTFKGQAKDGKYNIEGYKGEPSLEMDVAQFRINPGVYGDKHSGKLTEIKKQMHSYFDRLTMSEEGARGFMNDIHSELIHGVPEFNAYRRNKDRQKYASS